jgi:hypothetical protein
VGEFFEHWWVNYLTGDILLNVSNESATDLARVKLTRPLDMGGAPLFDFGLLPGEQHRWDFRVHSREPVRIALPKDVSGYAIGIDHLN